MQDNNEIVDCKNVSVNFSLDENTEYGSVFIVESSEVGKIVIDIIALLDRYELVYWGFNTSEKYKNIRGNCLTSSQVLEQLMNEIDNAKSRKL